MPFPLRSGGVHRRGRLRTLPGPPRLLPEVHQPEGSRCEQPLNALHALCYQPSSLCSNVSSLCLALSRELSTSLTCLPSTSCLTSLKTERTQSTKSKCHHGICLLSLSGSEAKHFIHRPYPILSIIPSFKYTATFCFLCVRTK